MKFPIRLGIALAVSATFVAPPPAAAQATDDDSIALEEVIVTSRRREESLQSVPIAVTVKTAAELVQLNITDVESLARYVPSLSFDVGNLPMDTRPVIRGISAQRGRPNVAILVDDVDVSSEALTVAGGGMTSNLRLLDVERVEVVKGPQSALYGRSAFAGAVNYVSKRPGDEFEFDIMVDYNEHEAIDARAVIAGPLTDKFGARLVASHYDFDGYYQNPNTGGDLGGAESQGVALALEYEFTDSVSAYLRIEESQDEYTPRPEVFVSSMTSLFDPAVNFLGTGTITDAAVMYPHTFPAVCNTIDRVQPNYDSFGLGPPCRPLITGELSADESMLDLSADPRTGRDFRGSELDTTRVHFDIDAEYDNLKFDYIFGYMDSDASVEEDFDKNDATILSVPFAFSQYGLSAMSQQQISTKQYNHELRFTIDNDRWSLMLSYLHWKEEMESEFDDEWWLRQGGDPAQVLALFNQAVFNYLDPVPPFFPGMCAIIYPGVPGCVNDVTYIATGLGDTPHIPLTRDTEHNSLALMGVFNLTDTFTMTLEGRYLRESIRYTGDSADISFYSQFGQDPWWGFMFGPGESTQNQVTENKFVPKITLDWAVSEEVMLYAYYAEGFKPGGVSTTDANGDVSTGEYKSERLQAYEFGLKSTWRDNSIRFNAAVFLNDYTDQQVPYQFVSPTTGLLQTSVINAGETEINGVEVELTWNSAFLDGLSASLNYTHVDAEFTSFNLTEILAPIGGGPSTFNRTKAGNNEGDFTGHVPPHTPENSGTLSLRYDGDIGSNSRWFIEGIGIYSGERFVGDDNRSYLPSYTTLDLFGGFGSGNWDVTLYVINATDDDEVKSGLGVVDYGLLPDYQSVPAAVTLILPQPRTAGLRFQYAFGN